MIARECHCHNSGDPRSVLQSRNYARLSRPDRKDGALGRVNDCVKPINTVDSKVGNAKGTSDNFTHLKGFRLRPAAELPDFVRNLPD